MVITTSLPNLQESRETIEALVLQKEDKDGRLILSKKRAEYERAWNRVEEDFNNGQNVEGEVIEVVKGGLILDIGLRGFLPASLVDLRRVKDLDMYLNTEIEARVIEMDRNRNNVVLSRRALPQEGVLLLGLPFLGFQLLAAAGAVGFGKTRKLDVFLAEPRVPHRLAPAVIRLRQRPKPQRFPPLLLGGGLRFQLACRPLGGF